MKEEARKELKMEENNKERCLLIKFRDGQSLSYDLKAKDRYFVDNGFLILVLQDRFTEGYNINDIKRFKEFLD
jgi:hypothetical protein